ncbi:aspartyl-phosphate phosphatase Spo0E family protein [Ureibacillus thermophilus]|uniref:Aspartyl-phosphate phosphatase Spo0E family protein n=1 Tax=Ureibacillus thermophilus TaxID=367743 RepID=A0A4P6UQT9_9BACL|nr:aspartyl-phosphate phosphatase Spo0E family protein [Ureibacillus thermophilus]QBK25463.1 aspartyl-phosphate phosphatase Spo0E family protein [Ureibacillus thermophilus]
MEELLIQLEHLREKMIRSGLEHGLQSKKTIQLSKQLDKIIDQYVQQTLVAISKK